MMSKKSPQLRFEGFTDDWEQRKLGEVSDIFDGTHQTPKYTESGIKFVSVENIKNLETKKFISIEAYEKEYANKKAEKGDVLMSRIGDIGTTNVVKDNSPLAYYVTLALLKPKHIDSNFLSWVINSREVQNDIWRHTLHIAFPKKINLGEINKVDLAIPSIEEQTKIGNFFKQLDDTIALHQRKLDLLKEQKKGYLQKMFPKNGAKVPELRFAGFADDWEQRKLGELVDFIVDNRGKNPPCYHNQGIPVIDNYMIKNTRYPNLSLANRYIDKNTYNSFIRKQTLHDDILITLVGNGIGNICLSPNEVSVIIQNTLGLRFNLNNKDFMFYTLQDKNGEIKKLDRGMAQPSIRQDELLNIEILIPKKVEQTKIGSFFKQLDDTIALHQRKLDLLKEQKKGFLQKMFI